MRTLFKIASLVLMVVLCPSCQKETTAPENSGLLKVIQAPGPYSGRNTLLMPDGSFLVGSVGFENEQLISEYGFLPSLLTRMDRKGEVIWQVELPALLYELWTCRLLRSGNILALGFNEQPNSAQVGLAIVSGAGEVLHTHSFFNSAGIFNSGDFSSIDGIELQNGNIGVVMPSAVSQQGRNYVRYLEFTTSLDVIADVTFEANDIVPDISIRRPSIGQTPTGDLIVQGVVFSDNTFAFVMQIDPESYQATFFNLFQMEHRRMPSRIAISSSGEAIWMSSGPDLITNNINDIVGLLHNFRNQEEFLYGSSIECWKTNGDLPQAPVSEIAGFPKNGFVRSVSPCSDGGYILAGTCNINSDQNIPSNYRILLVKLNAELGVEWLRVPNTSSAALAADAVEIPEGFLVTATHYSPTGVERPILFITNTEGILQ